VHQDSFDKSVLLIKEAYKDLGHTLGWRFLYSPKRTLSEHTKLMLMGANPGGSTYEAPIASCEAGNAYRREVESWPSGLQDQICALFRNIATPIGDGTEWWQLLDTTLTSNFCPFRSRGWDDLPQKSESVTFSRKLWTPLCRELSPRDHLHPSGCGGGAGHPLRASGLQGTSSDLQADRLGEDDHQVSRALKWIPDTRNLRRTPSVPVSYPG
jgi:hypothetical protein